jgi:hypothetical protein
VKPVPEEKPAPPPEPRVPQKITIVPKPEPSAFDYAGCIAEANYVYKSLTFENLRDYINNHPNCVEHPVSVRTDPAYDPAVELEQRMFNLRQQIAQCEKLTNKKHRVVGMKIPM